MLLTLGPSASFWYKFYHFLRKFRSFYYLFMFNYISKDKQGAYEHLKRTKHCKQAVAIILLKTPENRIDTHERPSFAFSTFVSLHNSSEVDIVLSPPSRVNGRESWRAASENRNLWRTVQKISRFVKTLGWQSRSRWYYLLSGEEKFLVKHTHSPSQHKGHFDNPIYHHIKWKV